MKITKEDSKIIDLFRKNILSSYTIEDIMKQLKKRSYSWTYNTLIKLKGLLIVKKVGKAYSIGINLENHETTALLAYMDTKEAFEKKVPVAEKIIDSISKKTVFFTLLVTGSYATSTQRKGSDIDLVIIVGKAETKKEILPYIKEVTRLEEVETHIHIFTKEEFYTMLISEEENFGKEFFRKHLLFYGADAYYQIIKEAIRSGLSFKI